MDSANLPDADPAVEFITLHGFLVCPVVEDETRCRRSDCDAIGFAIVTVVLEAGEVNYPLCGKCLAEAFSDESHIADMAESARRALVRRLTNTRVGGHA